MDADDFPKLTMSRNGIAVPISKHWIRIMGHIKHLIWENIENNVPEAELTSKYTLEMFHEYVMDYNRMKHRSRSLPEFRILSESVDSCEDGRILRATFYQQAIELQRQAEAEKIRERIAEDDQYRAEAEAIKLQRQADSEADKIKQRHAEIDAERRRCEIEAEAEKIKQRHSAELQRHAEADKIKQRHAEDDRSEKIPHNQAIRFAAERRRCEFEADAEDERHGQALAIKQRDIEMQTFEDNNEDYIQDTETNLRNQAKAEDEQRHDFRNGEDFRNCKICEVSVPQGHSAPRRLSELRRLLKLRNRDDFRNCEVSFPRRLSKPFRTGTTFVHSLQIVEDNEFRKNFQSLKTFESAKSHHNKLPPAEPPPTEPPPTRFSKSLNLTLQYPIIVTLLITHIDSTRSYIKQEDNVINRRRRLNRMQTIHRWENRSTGILVGS